MNKYCIPSARLASWDYSNPGSYFITICTKNRKHFFGEIINGEMFLTETGMIADKCWAEIPVHFKNVLLGEFVIMPNHVHGIINIDEPPVDSKMVDKTFAVSSTETGHALSLQGKHFRFRNPGKNSVSAMVGSFKSAVTKLARSINIHFGWQTRFHDHIIRSHDDYLRISNYILNNPRNWESDKFNQ